ncbi:hypothetical protein [Flammeovirga sp. SubArs3]|uniref:hypothetical protein n=1 Tax=Flammeovirga sp. SubArs3 TaxID=2995316 RepID=UPI00248BCFF0|nr:hypothetical protein [Flammeovirga sp. SubArs3]
MKNSVFCLIIAIAIIFTQQSYGQKVPKKLTYGKVSKELLALKSYDKDSTANALVIGDMGWLTFDIENNSWIIRTKRHLRIKVFNKEAFYLGNIKLPYYKYKGTDEVINSIKGAIYYLEKGKVVKKKIDQSDVRILRHSKTKGFYKVTFPRLREGCVIELFYNKNSEFLSHIDNWEVQREIPVLMSAFSMEIPESMKYKVVNSRYFPIKELPSTGSSKTFNLRTKDNTSLQSLTLVKTTNDEYIQNYNVRRWRVEQVPAFKEEPFMTSPQDYLARLKFELFSANNKQDYHSNSWTGVVKVLNLHSRVGDQMHRVGFMKERLDAIKNKTPDHLERAKLAYDIISKRMNWNKELSVYCHDGGTRKAYLDRRGNVAEINLMLFAALEYLNVPTIAVFSSTRGYTMITPDEAEINRLNYVLAAINIDGKYILLDATTKSHPFGVLPLRALNYQGVILSKNQNLDGKLLSIEPTSLEYKSIQSRVSINRDLSAICDFTVSYKGYDAINWRNKHLSKSEETYLEEKENQLEGLTVESYEREGAKSLNSSIKEIYKFNLEKCIEDVGGQLVFNPMVMIETSKNPFTQETRRYPVELPYGVKRKYMIQVEIPDNLAIKELPKPQIVRMPGNSGKLKYVITQTSDRSFMILFDLEIKKIVFSPDEYSLLKNFFDQIYKFHTSPVLLVKNEM